MTVEAKWMSIQKNNGRLYLNGEETTDIDVNGKILEYFIQGNIIWLRILQEQGKQEVEPVEPVETGSS
jgi:hypothetical protein